MKTFKQVVETLRAYLANEEPRQPEPPKPPDADKLIQSMLNAAAGTPQPGDFKVHFDHPMAKEVLNTIGDPKEDHENEGFAYIKAEPTKRGILFNWGARGFGFGECALIYENGRWVANTEGLSKHFLEDLLAEFAKTVEIRK